MKIKFAAMGLMIGVLFAPVMTYADASPETSNAKTVVKDSVITTKIKAQLAAENFASITQLKVDTDDAGQVFLRGTASSDVEAAKAVSIARATEGVSSVKSEILIKREEQK
ncbi:MAG: Transport-associated protein [Verrucomicrobiaceae bacterium]|nr:Transport-associated protein [Verrucomicrobiaceae bacterium]